MIFMQNPSFTSEVVTMDGKYDEVSIVKGPMTIDVVVTVSVTNRMGVKLLLRFVRFNPRDCSRHQFRWNSDLPKRKC